MKSYDHPTSSTKYKLWLILLALFSTALILFSTNPYGAGLSSDSVDYISAARNIMKSVGVYYYDGTPLVFYPPLYPALLAFVGKIVGLDPVLFAHFVNAFLFGLIVYLGGLLIFKYLKFSLTFVFVGTLAIVFSKPLFTVSVMAWSEPLFICFVLLSLIFAHSYIAKNNITSLISFSSSVALLPLVRYAGIILILWGVLIIFIFNRTDSFKNRIKHLTLFVIISILPIGLWLIRNYITSSTLFGTRFTSVFTNYPLSKNLLRTFYIIIKWYAPILLYCCVGVGFVSMHRLRDTWQFVKVKMRQIGPVALFIIIYITFLVVSATPLHIGRIDDRLLSPVYVPLTLLLLILTQALIEIYQKRFFIRIVHSLLIVGILIWLIYPPLTVGGEVVDQIHNGDGYSGKDWRGSRTVQYLCQRQISESGCTYYTNSAETIYILANFTAKMSPYKVNDISKLEGLWPEESKAYLIWFDRIDRTDIFTILELNKIANIDLIARFEDGAFYSITRK